MRGKGLVAEGVGGGNNPGKIMVNRRELVAVGGRIGAVVTEEAPWSEVAAESKSERDCDCVKSNRVRVSEGCRK